MSNIAFIRRLPLLAVLFTSPLLAQVQLESTEQKAGYSMGANIGFNLAEQGIAADLDLDTFVAGFKDAVAGNMQMTEEEIVASLQALSELQQAKANAQVEEMAQAGQDFLTANADAEGVITTKSGLQYMVLSEGESGAKSPSSRDTVEVHYHGTMIDGTVFDSSVDRGESVSFAVNGVIPGWTEGLQLMKVGDKYRFFIPSELGYGAQAIGPLPPNSVLIFDVDLLSVE